MKAEMEMAMKLLEKDVHEKQDTIISLRDQLEDIKNINLEMYTKLQVCSNITYHNVMTDNVFFSTRCYLKECESEISAKSEIITKLETKTEEISRMLIRLNELG